MSLTSGFFNSDNGDRRYNADQLNSVFDGLISEGIFQDFGDAFKVTATSGMKVSVGSGRAVIGSDEMIKKWVYNDAAVPVTIKEASTSANRYTAVVLRLNVTNRTITLETIDGTAATTPSYPEIVRTSTIMDICLAYIYVAAGTYNIEQSAITDTRGNRELCGYVTGIVQQANATLITADDGGPKLSHTSTTKSCLDTFTDEGLGFHTMYVASGSAGTPETGAFRMFGHITNVNPATGWIIAMQADGSVYSNYVNAGTWRGWRSIFDVTPSLLYQSANGTFLNDATTVTPSKRLSECQHGWVLTFTGYDDETNVGRDYYVQTICIPKRSYKGTQWSGESMTISLVYSYNEGSDTNLQCTKTLYIHDDHISGSSFNGQGISRKMVLRAIQEY